VSARIHVRRFESYWARLRGLLGRPAPGPGEGVVLEPCRQVHTFGMSYAIDAVYLDAGGSVLAIATLVPWRVGPFRRRAAAVLELAAGEAGRLGLVVGEKPSLIEVAADATRIEPP
jgi:uncharacterized protein